MLMYRNARPTWWPGKMYDIDLQILLERNGAAKVIIFVLCRAALYEAMSNDVYPDNFGRQLKIELN
jgi:hypothetical protein